MKLSKKPISKGMGVRIFSLVLACVLFAPAVWAEEKSATEKAQDSLDQAKEKLIECQSKGKGGCEKELAKVTKAAMNVGKAQNAQYESDECAKSNAFGGDIQGRNCVKAMRSVKEVATNNQLTSQVSTAAFGMTSQIAAMRSTGNQVDAQRTTGRIMQGAAVTKMLEAGVQGYGIKQLSESATAAETTSKKLSDLKEQIVTTCGVSSNSAKEKEACARQLVTKANGPKLSNDKDYDDIVTFVSDAASQATEQANAARNAQTSSGAAAAINSLVGLQAWVQARRAMQFSQQMATPPQVYALNPMTGSSAAPVIPGALPDDFGANGNDGSNLLGGPVRHGMTSKPSTPIVGAGSAPFVSRKATISSGSSLGGGGVGSGKSAATLPRKGARSYNSSIGSYEAGSGTPGGSKGSSSADQSNPFADTLAKLFGADGSQDPGQLQGAVADGRSLASEGDMGNSEVYATEISIFEQVTTKYRQLAANGSI